MDTPPTSVCRRSGRALVRAACLGAGALATLGLAVPAAAASPAPLHCGATVTTNVALTADLLGCSDVGLAVGTDNVTVNLSGHTIAGTATSADGSVGILIDGHHGVRITHGSVTGFDVGILVVGSSLNNINAMAVQHNAGDAVILAAGASDNSVTDDRLTHNGLAAVGVFGADRNTITNDFMADDGPQGVEILFSDATAVHGNQILDTGSGVILESSDDTTITGNQIIHSVAAACEGCGIGVQVYGNRNLVAANSIIDSPRYGIEVDDFQDPGHSPAVGNVIKDNVVSSAGEGISIGPEAGGVVLNTLIASNRVNNATDDGIQLVGPSTGLQTSTVTGNVSVHNGSLGINSVLGTTDGGGNIAAANGNPLQCLNIICR